MPMIDVKWLRHIVVAMLLLSLAGCAFFESFLAELQAEVWVRQAREIHQLLRVDAEEVTVNYTDADGVDVETTASTAQFGLDLLNLALRYQRIDFADPLDDRTGDEAWAVAFGNAWQAAYLAAVAAGKIPPAQPGAVAPWRSTWWDISSAI